ncbi:MULTISPECIES: site-specific integrase [Pseudoalteromonas]|uniref:Site-specific integrase n=2 Tax=Pseudoalteromonas TaxID=53246 RepID=A0A8I2KQI6_9GAMM|nr:MULTISPECIES: site-specific integrase [Pseudoalteromonas]KYL37045.1 hypothetical protein A2I96_06100 [Pseudoalteromonas spiralis]MDN3489614.1 site-specific integrase [Pseudoalteromonas sp. APC 3694]NLR21968.1 site-specific integrase [Pseudoalteromonas maricaloris]QWF33371.1 site-specific integrase [Pseudoalteromonas sp. SiA1]WOX28615.1 site-specific integrase [Pseudoalteromonas maricaloris]
MIESKLVESIPYGGRKISTYALVNNDIPLVHPSAFLLHTAVNNLFGTVTTYMKALKSFYKEIISKTNLSIENIERLTDQEMSGYLVGVLQRQRKLKHSSIENHIAVLKEFFKYLYQSGFTTKEMLFSYAYENNEYEQSFLSGVKTDMHEAYFHKKKFQECLLCYVDSQSSFMKKRNELVLQLGYYAGFRAFEVVLAENLNIETFRQLLPKVDFFIPKAIHINIYGKGNSIRTTPFEPSLVKSIYEFIWGEAKHIKSGNMICQENGKLLKDKTFASKLFRKCADKYCENTSLTLEEAQLWKHRGFHKLRKCFATNSVTACRDNGDDPWIYVPQWLGHKRKSTTFGYIYFEALLNKREDVLHALSLEETKYGKDFKRKSEKA